MSRFRVVQISDTHLSRERPAFLDNWRCVAAWLVEDPPDMVINTGDIAVDAPRRPDDLAFARDLHDGLAAPVRAIPGNHDVGDNPAPGYQPKDPVGAAALAHYRSLFGPDWWQADLGAWRFVGLNAQLLGAGHPDEPAQWRFLEQALATDRPVAVWLHKPLFNNDPAEETEAAHRYVAPAPRRRLLGLLERAPVRLVASGHTHQSRHTRLAGVDLVWCPSTAFVLGAEAMQPRIGTKEVGLVDYRFEGDRVFIAIGGPALAGHDIADFPQVYG